ncbi:MAG TPA: glycosyltransferase family 4 protein [bacterium]|nr:glycosyltransferase family 4 protein [bacterium]
MPANGSIAIDQLNTIAVLGNYMPRQCGIATFTTDLCETMAREFSSSVNIMALAINDIENGYAYPKRVKFELRANIPGDYLRAADFLNINQIDVLVVQHEYGIFGGEHGAHLFHLLHNVKMPVITTLHTVLADPHPKQRAVILELADRSEKLVVMSQRAKQMLTDIYGIPDSHISLIPHGIHDVPFIDPSFYKDKFQWQDKKVIFTFGLLGPSKGLEVMIEAMPRIVEAHPNAVYVILGATHPHILRESGEEYRHSLRRRIDSLGLHSHVVFHNQFVDPDTLKEYISAADLYVTPYLNKEQITSGTLAYAVGSGKAVVSTPYWYAEELLDEDRGCLVPFGDTNALADTVTRLLADDVERNAIRKRAYLYGRAMTWEKVIQEYVRLASDVLSHRRKKAAVVVEETDRFPKVLDELPKINLQHLRTLTDDTGMLQHAFFAIPDRDHGYCVDDNARALIATCLHYKLLGDDSVLPLIKTYLSYLYHAFNTEKGRFRNFMSYDRQWVDEVGSEDAHGRAIWSLGVTVSTAPNKTLRDSAARLFGETVDVVERFTSPRARAYSSIGLHNYLEVYGGDAMVKNLVNELSDRLFRLFQENHKPDWPWFEETVTYSNGILCQALLLTGRKFTNPEMVEAGLAGLKWLLDQQTSPKGHLSLIGNDDWFKRWSGRSTFDQQPVEILGLIQACGEAYRVTSDSQWIQEAKRCLGWFLGQNDLEVQLYDYQTGGCCDGLHPTGANANQGAESTLAWLISLMEMHNLLADEILMKEHQRNSGRKQNSTRIHTEKKD